MTIIDFPNRSAVQMTPKLKIGLLGGLQFVMKCFFRIFNNTNMVSVSNSDFQKKETVYLMASSERKTSIWKLDSSNTDWQLCYAETTKWGGMYNDISLRSCQVAGGASIAQNATTAANHNQQQQVENTHGAKFIRITLCDWRKAKLKSLVLDDQFEIVIIQFLIY